MKNDLITLALRGRSSFKPKTPNKSPLKSLISEEEILNARKRTIPMPFTLHTSSKNKKAFDSQKAFYQIAGIDLGIEVQRSARLMYLSPRKPSTSSPRSIKSAIKSRVDHYAPFKRVQFDVFPQETKFSITKKKQWKKIFSSIKTTAERAPKQCCLKETKKKPMYTIKDIKEM